MIILVLGGTRSGKSAVAESTAAQLAGTGGHVTYVATARLDEADADHAARIDAHRRRRPEGWTSVECPDPGALPAVLRDATGVVLLDSLGTWVAGHAELDPDPGPLLDALRTRGGTTVLVSEEVGLALHATTEVGRRFVDALGEVNRAVSSIADHAVLVVAGRAIELPPPGELPC